MEAIPFNFTPATLESLAERTLNYARQQGATSAEVDVSEGLGQTVTVRLGEVETIEHHQDKGVVVTVYIGNNKGHASTSDFSDNALRETVRAALDIARYTATDPCAGLADPALLATQFPDLALFHPWDIAVDDAIGLAQACETAARTIDPRITNSEGATVATQRAQFVYANSQGFCQGFPSSRHSLSVAVVAGEGGHMQRDYWYSVARDSTELESAQAVGQRAGERALRRLNARRLKTGRYPVLFEAGAAHSLIGHWVAAISGGNLYRKSSFLLDSLGTQVFARQVNIDEDPLIPRGLASSAFDSEGVATQKRRLIDQGVVQGYMLSSYSARKLGMQTTGNAGGPHNLIVHSTGHNFGQLLSELGTGLLVTELMGQGVNTVTGDYSRGAAGFWVQDGVIAWPVEEITIAGHLREMYGHIVAIGDDVLIRGGKRCGSILIESMMVAGEE